MTLPPDAAPACYGEADLFESRYPADHRAAKKLCADCPMFAACDRLRIQTEADYPGALEGTWAGKHYNPIRKLGRPFAKESAA